MPFTGNVVNITILLSGVPGDLARATIYIETSSRRLSIIIASTGARRSFTIEATLPITRQVD